MSTTQQEPTQGQEAAGNAFPDATPPSWMPLCSRRGCQSFARRGGPGKRGHHGTFCCDSCRTWAHKHPEDDMRPVQATIPAEPPVELVQRIGPTPEDIRASQKAQTVRVLRMLQAGPQTTHTFLAAYIGRFGARIEELRRVGHRIEMRKLGKHAAVYTLVGGA